MDRRKFLSMLAVGAPAALVAAKLGLAERHPFQNYGASSGVCTVCGDTVMEHESVALGPPNRIVRLRRIIPEADMGRGSSWAHLERFPCPSKLQTPFAFRSE
jgi:hypothetical protein